MRTRKRLATFAAAMSSTNATAPNSSHNARTIVRADDDIAQRRDVHRETGAVEKGLLVDVGILRLHSLLHALDVGERGGDGHTRLEQADRRMRVIVDRRPRSDREARESRCRP